MEVLRDVATGALMWLLSLSALGGTIVGFEYMWGPPLADRARNFAHIAGGAVLFLLILAMIAVAAAIVNDRS